MKIYNSRKKCLRFFPANQKVNLIDSFPCSAPTPPPVTGDTFVEKHGNLRVEGKNMVDEHGRIITLRGYSFGWHVWDVYAPFWNYDCVKWLRDDFKCTVIRPWVGAEVEGGFVNNHEHTRQHSW